MPKGITTHPISSDMKKYVLGIKIRNYKTKTEKYVYKNVFTNDIFHIIGVVYSTKIIALEDTEVITYVGHEEVETFGYKSIGTWCYDKYLMSKMQIKK